ncbi:hypothetical protein QWZ13_12330 [Reinekea marina]|uniref:Uncharacterized protein n=1 Tax=Reinekea marina TaxID=1310421 RepID=A0ABV7WXC1_9GAMM|nr:hypothetical protein [Reinekea marina]MBU2865204.1 hypothetical protein [Reinekea forsetii]MDN3649699.1 hypothetical protein [Reinekea marina]
MAVKKSKFKTIVIPIILALGFTFAMVLAVDEMVANQGEYRPSVWDVLNGRGELPQGRAEVSQQVAIQVCKQEAIDSYGRDLMQTNFDKRSSRYNSELKVHTVFVNLRVKDQEDLDLYIRCDVSAVNRQMLETRIKGGKGFGFFKK